MRKKITLIFLSIAMFFCSFTMVGCSSEKLIKQTNESLKGLMTTIQDEVDKDENSIFTQGKVHNDCITTDYRVSYGTSKINKYVSEDISKLIYDGETYSQTYLSTYSSLDYIYNSLFSISLNYISKYSNSFEFSIAGEDYSKAQKKSLTNLRKSIKKFEKEFDNFEDSWKEFINFYEKTESHNGTTEGELDQLRKYKISYGKLIGKTIDVAQKLVEAREQIIYGVMNETKSANVIKEYAVIKTLDMYYEFFIGELDEKVAYSSTTNTVDQGLFYDIYDSVYNNFDDVIRQLVGIESDVVDMSKEEVEEIMNSIDAIINDKNIFISALKDFDIKEFGVKYNNDLTKYTKENKTARVDLEKMRQISQDIMPNYIALIESIMF